MHGHPTLYRKSFNILLQRRGRGILSRSQLAKSPEALRILQMELQFFVRQTPVLFQNRAPQDLLGGHAVPTRIYPVALGKIVVNAFQDLGMGMDNFRDTSQLLGYSILGQVVPNA